MNPKFKKKLMIYSPPRYLLRRFVILRSIRKSESFLEVGPGNLMLSAELTKYFDNGTVIDFEENVKKYYSALPKKTSKKIDLIIGDLFEVKFKKKFSCVISCEVMEHIKNDKQFIERLFTLTDKGGQVVVSVPAKKRFWTVHDEAVGHYRRYEKRDLIAMFEKNGFKNIKVISYGFPFINLLWRLRALHGRIQMRSKKDMSVVRRTKDSGINQVPKSLNVLGFIANKYVFYLPNIFASLFYKIDWSEGYVVTANK